MEVITHRGQAEVNAARLYYEARGSGPALVFIPGGTVDATHYAAVAERLANDFYTVTYDRRANSRSPRPTGWYATSIAEQARDVAGLIETLGLAPCAVWAGSLGGLILLELLVRRPGLVRAAMVHEPPLFGVLDDGEKLAKGLLGTAARAIRHNAVREEFRNHVGQSIGEAFNDLATDAQERMFSNAEVFFDLEIPAIVGYLPDPAGASRTLQRVDVPITVMADSHNQGTPPVRAAGWLAQHFETELRYLPGGHMPYATEPETTAAAIHTIVAG
ncbi:alpha/beta hydrolase [Mycobacterium sp.]|jgi:pimeloyl-ACP methyl ester carboxylesterase|uniref:alpha/beta fold hydrolase n=1 Tax=Mycobacterium sp. TaxID=1785 RepID=UPI002D574300|nr:alpha/beta hydrolase [Mycobacterium sp.]HZA11880.1 alpha/beta hydrolase [Mycobacterium sp.]